MSKNTHAAIHAANNAFESSRQMHEAVTAGMREEAGSGLYSIDTEALRALAPDVIITQARGSNGVKSSISRIESSISRSHATKVTLSQ